jgi:hypothetical protein
MYRMDTIETQSMGKVRVSAAYTWDINNNNNINTNSGKRGTHKSEESVI